MRALVLLMMIALAFAGCAGDDGGTDEDPTKTIRPTATPTSDDEPNVEEPGSPPPSTAAQRFNETYSLQFSQVSVGGRTTSGTNCVILEQAEPYTPLFLNVDATWTPATGGQSLELRVRGPGFDEIVGGGSPLNITLENLDEVSGDDEIWILMQGPETTAVVDQAVELSVTLDYASDDTISARTASCGVSG